MLPSQGRPWRVVGGRRLKVYYINKVITLEGAMGVKAVLDFSRVSRELPESFAAFEQTAGSVARVLFVSSLLEGDEEDGRGWEVAWLSGRHSAQGAIQEEQQHRCCRATYKQQELSKQNQRWELPLETCSHGQALMLYLKSLLIQFYMICWHLNVEIWNILALVLLFLCTSYRWRDDHHYQTQTLSSFLSANNTTSLTTVHSPDEPWISQLRYWVVGL